MKKKISAILFIAVLLLPSSVSFMWLQHRKNMVRAGVEVNINKGIDREELLVLGFTMEEAETLLRWEHSREFEYKHQMYDIVEVSTVGDSIYYLCWWDVAETIINNKLGEIARYNFDTEARKEGQQQNPVKIFKLLYVNDIDDWHATAPDPPEMKYAFVYDLYHSLTFPPPEPPPRMS